jgi:hypothetical protein
MRTVQVLAGAAMATSRRKNAMTQPLETHPPDRAATGTVRPNAAVTNQHPEEVSSR